MIGGKWKWASANVRCGTGVPLLRRSRRSSLLLLKRQIAVDSYEDIELGLRQSQELAVSNSRPLKTPQLRLP